MLITGYITCTHIYMDKHGRRRRHTIETQELGYSNNYKNFPSFRSRPKETTNPRMPYHTLVNFIRHTHTHTPTHPHTHTHICVCVCVQESIESGDITVHSFMTTCNESSVPLHSPRPLLSSFFMDNLLPKQR